MTPTQALQSAREALAALLYRHGMHSNGDIKLGADALSLIDSALATGEPATTATKVCHVCGDETQLCCSDCAINFGASVYVCKKPSCRDGHEIKCWGSKPIPAIPPGDEVEAVAKAINDARYGPDYPPKMKRTFEEADHSDREYSLRLTRAAISALNAHRSAHQAIPSGLAEEFELLCKRVKKFEEDHGPCSLRDDLALLCLDHADAILDALRALTPSSAEKPNDPGETKNSP